MHFLKTFLFLFIIFQIKLFAFPVSIRDNWFVKEGKDLQFGSDPSSWQNFKELSVNKPTTTESTKNTTLSKKITRVPTAGDFLSRNRIQRYVMRTSNPEDNAIHTPKTTFA